MRILLALDSCRQSAEAALALTRQNQAELTVLFVMDATWNVYVGHDWLSGSGSRADFLDWVKEEEEKAAQAAFADLRARAGGLPFLEKIAAGDVREEIVKEARAGGYDLLVMANPFDRGLEVMRKPAPDIARDNPCSVLLVNRESKSGQSLFVCSR